MIFPPAPPSARQRNPHANANARTYKYTHIIQNTERIVVKTKEIVCRAPRRAQRTFDGGRLLVAHVGERHEQLLGVFAIRHLHAVTDLVTACVVDDERDKVVARSLCGKLRRDGRVELNLRGKKNQRGHSFASVRDERTSMRARADTRKHTQAKFLTSPVSAFCATSLYGGTSLPMSKTVIRLSATAFFQTLALMYKQQTPVNTGFPSAVLRERTKTKQKKKRRN